MTKKTEYYFDNIFRIIKYLCKTQWARDVILNYIEQELTEYVFNVLH